MKTRIITIEEQLGLVSQSGYQKGYQKGFLEGFLESIIETKAETTETDINLLDLLDIPVLAKKMGLSIEDVEQLVIERSFPRHLSY